jgi:drug/metabolite transporter (DMT)-like permease
MQGINHVAFGSLIAVTIKQPLLVAPFALASHFVLDILPHHGNDPYFRRGSRAYILRSVFDALASLILAIILARSFPDLASVIYIGAFLSIFPDFFWAVANRPLTNTTLIQFLQFHKRIQTRESRRGIYFEIFWFVLVLFLLYQMR